MKEVFLALKANNSHNSLSPEIEYSSRWISEISLFAAYIKDGWQIYRINDITRIEQVEVNLIMEKSNG